MERRKGLTLSKTKGGMMKNKTIAFLVVVSLLALPVVASAATEFTLGGYIKLDMFWDSSQVGKNLNTPVARNNNPINQHGRFQATSQSSRFNFTIKGPDLWGAKTTGYLEVDFDQQGDTRQSASNSYIPRLRHAFFRMNWPGTELLLGQYWGYFCEFYPELIQDGPFQGHGQATQRLPQIRVTQDFGVGSGKMTLSGLVGAPVDATDTLNPAVQESNAALPGQEAEGPQLQAKIQWEGDLWGKGPFYGRPRGFTAQVAGAWQRNRYRSGTGTFVGIDQPNAAGPNALLSVTRTQRDQQYLNSWAVQGTLFLPIIPTATNNLAGTASLTLQAYIGDGLNFIGNVTGQNSFMRQVSPAGSAAGLLYDRSLQRTWGGYALGQYYFSNQWFLVGAFGVANNFGSWDKGFTNGFFNTVWVVDPVETWWEADLVLYYRPITAIKFGLGYSYSKTQYYAKRSSANQVNIATDGPDAVDHGENHRVEFGAWFFF